MSLSTGAQIGPYTIGDEIGSGGMGVVYRATDQNLKRDVAIKALPESLAADAERLARFQREAEVLASLNHPNIAQIYGLERSEGTTVLVMELVEGPTLADRIAKGPLSREDAIGTAMQIADALEAAHSQNIVHRDLKPANIKLRPDGTVKVLDFGIAKALEPDVVTSAPQSPIMTTPATQVGVILGTAAYMSPEQARGKRVDQRTDVWAFGCLLYEMLTGQLAFGGEDVSVSLARIIAGEINFNSLPSSVSPSLRLTIELCLKKSPRERLHSIGDARLLLEGAFDGARSQTDKLEILERSHWERSLPVASAIAITSATLGLVAWTLWPEPENQAVTRFVHELPEGQTYRFVTEPILDLSRDGRQFVYNTEGGLYVRSMDSVEARLIPGTERPISTPVFSPDSQSLIVWGEGPQIRRMAVSGGASILVADGATQIFGLNWGSNGSILAGTGAGVWRIPQNGGPTELVIEVDQFEGAFFPRYLPDGDTVIFSMRNIGQPSSLAQIVAHSISTNERTVLIDGGFDARYVPTGHLIYAYENSLFAVAFDPENLTTTGGAVPVVEGVLRTVGGGSLTAHYSISDEGTLVYAEGSLASIGRRFVWVDRDGREQDIPLPPRAYTSPRISPDGMRLALNPRDEEWDVWIWDFTRETLSRLTFDSGEDEFPLWSPDGNRIVFSSSRDGGSPADTSLYWKAADGTGAAELVVEDDAQIFPTSFLLDGSGVIVYGSDETGGDDNISLVSMDDRVVTPLLATNFNEAFPELSPDGNWLAYTSDESGSQEVYVRPFPDVEAGRWQISTGGGAQPLWSPDGTELFYRSGESLMSVAIETSPRFTASNAQVVFQGDYVLTQGGRSYDISRDGQRFLMLKTVDDRSETPRIVIVQNWHEELERLVPTD